MASLLNLENLSNKLNNAVTSTDGSQTVDPNTGAVSNSLAQNVGGAVQSWLQSSIFPLIIGFAIFATVAAVFYGGFLYFTAYGDENKAANAKKSITFGFIGLIIVLLAFTITSYVRQNLLSKQSEETIYQGYSAPVTDSGDNSYTDSAQDLFN